MIKGKLWLATVLLFGVSVIPAQEENKLDWCDEAQWQAALKGEADVNARDWVGYTALHLADLPEEARRFIELGARDKWERTPLFRARTPEMVKLLVQHGADVNAKAQYHETALNLNLRSSQRAKVAEALLEAGAELNPENAMPPLHAACICGNLPMVEKLLRMGANPHLKSHAGKTAPDYARQRPEIVRLLENIQK